MVRVKNIIVVLMIGLCVATFTIIDIAQAKGGSISGHIYEADGKTPIGNARVKGVSAISPKETTTDTNGFFILKEMNAGIYLVQVSTDGYVSASKGNVSVQDNHITSNMDFILLRSGTISGSVFNELDSSPIAESNIKIFSVDNGRSWHSISESDGSFHISGIITGRYIISAEANGFAKLFVQNLKIESGKELGNINLNLNTGGSISGKVFESDEVTAISSAEIFLFDLNIPTNFLTTTSNASGEYSFDVVSAGEYSISCKIGENSFYKSDSLLITDGGNLLGIDFLNVANTGTVAGTVKEVDLFTPVAGAVVAIYSISIDEGFYYEETNSDGAYNLTNILPGIEYEMKIYKDGYIGEIRENIIITENQTQIIDVILQHE